MIETRVSSIDMPYRDMSIDMPYRDVCILRLSNVFVKPTSSAYRSKHMSNCSCSLHLHALDAVLQSPQCWCYSTVSTMCSPPVGHTTDASLSHKSRFLNVSVSCFNFQHFLSHCHDSPMCPFSLLQLVYCGSLTCTLHIHVACCLLSLRRLTVVNKS